MLLLTRKEGEKIRIGSEVVINVVSISDNQVKIGIEAPSFITIYREELYEKLKVIHKESTLKDFKPQLSELKKLKINKPDSDKEIDG